VEKGHTQRVLVKEQEPGHGADPAGEAHDGREAAFADVGGGDDFPVVH